MLFHCGRSALRAQCRACGETGVSPDFQFDTVHVQGVARKRGFPGIIERYDRGRVEGVAWTSQNNDGGEAGGRAGKGEWLPGCAILMGP